MSKWYMVWFHNNPACEEAILQRQEYEAVLTGYGENDFWLEFLVGSGLWETMVKCISFQADGQLDWVV